MLQSRNKEPEQPNKGEIEEKVSSGFNWFGKKSDQASKKADDKAPESKGKAIEIKDTVVSTVKSAADDVSGAAKDAQKKISDVSVNSMWWQRACDDQEHIHWLSWHALHDECERAPGKSRKYVEGTATI